MKLNKTDFINRMIQLCLLEDKQEQIIKYCEIIGIKSKISQVNKIDFLSCIFSYTFKSLNM
jgi:hypothetical protein